MQYVADTRVTMKPPLKHRTAHTQQQLVIITLSHGQFVGLGIVLLAKLVTVCEAIS